MVGLLIATHGSFGQELLKSAEMVLGSQKNAAAVGITPGEDKESFRKKFISVLQSFSETEGILILVDIFGGSPYQASYVLKESTSLEILSGVNLPMLLEFFLQRDGKGLTELAALVSQAGIQGIRG